MTASATENQETRTTNRRTSAQSKSSQQFEQSLQHTEAAVTELVHGSVNAARAFLPTAVVRPTEAVDYVFDLAEQVLSATRQTVREIASLIEAGTAGVERRAA